VIKVVDGDEGMAVEQGPKKRVEMEVIRRPLKRD
jgi:hypothetical protein